ncbi:hypothetical protein GGR57DRAFT_148804 [Xylariaceae sp. FL1272]|nr:hypothetical protein GGR57DRAFT_148804 [Xylariaceae sp. FL1272]
MHLHRRCPDSLLLDQASRPRYNTSRGVLHPTMAQLMAFSTDLAFPCTFTHTAPFPSSWTRPGLYHGPTAFLARMQYQRGRLQHLPMTLLPYSNRTRPHCRLPWTRSSCFDLPGLMILCLGLGCPIPMSQASFFISSALGSPIPVASGLVCTFQRSSSARALPISPMASTVAHCHRPLPSPAPLRHDQVPSPPSSIPHDHLYCQALCIALGI